MRLLFDVIMTLIAVTAFICFLGIPLYWNSTGPFKGYKITKKYIKNNSELIFELIKDSDRRIISPGGEVYNNFNVGDTIK